MLIAVTDHAAERYLQRVGGALDPKPEIVRRVATAWEAGRSEEDPDGTWRVKDLRDRSLVFVCRRAGAELIVITLWEREGGIVPPRVPRQWTEDRGRRQR